MNDVSSVLEMLEEIQSDSLASKRLKEKITEIISILNDSNELKIDKAIHELEGLNGMEIPSYNRTQLWDVVSMLESIN
tara:strand:+ start:8656 stop:8889 length:234 start_codon:yes stop_codon:yes gene_type:complete